jgi:hypothetical protein
MRTFDPYSTIYTNVDFVWNKGSVRKSVAYKNKAGPLIPSNPPPNSQNMSHNEKRPDHGRRQTAIQQHQDTSAYLAPHTSNLSNALYILSFASPCPSPFRAPREFFAHPYTLYGIGTIGACLSGLGFPALDITFGWWTNGIRGVDATPESITKRGNDAGLIMLLVAIVFFFTFAMFVTCCECQGDVGSFIIDDASWVEICLT